MRELTGASATTAATALRGSGIAAFNIDPAELRDDQAASEAAAITAAFASAVAIGATKNSLNFNLTPVMFEAGFDGLSANDKANMVFDEWAADASFEFVEFSKANLDKMLMNSTGTDIGNGLTEIAPDESCVPEFIDNIAIRVDVMDCGQTVPAILVLYNVLSTDGISLATGTRQINSLPVSFKAHYATTGETKPWGLFIPTPA